MNTFILFWSIVNLLLFIGILVYFGVNQSILKKKIKDIKNEVDKEVEQYKLNADTQKAIYLEELTEEISRETDKTEKLIKDMKTQRQSYVDQQMDGVEDQIAAERKLRIEKMEREMDARKLEQDKEFQTFLNELEAKKLSAEEETNQIIDELEEFKKKRDVINQEILRQREVDEQTDFYRICLSQDDIDDLQAIQEVEHLFHNHEALHKAAYESYVRKPLMEMEKRVLGDKKVGGIYCITYIPTGEVYIGRSTDIPGRWVEHVKSAFSIGSIASQSIHTKMARDGVWNFTFQLLEEVPKDKQAEREKFYIDLYGSKSLLNEKAGG